MRTPSPHSAGSTLPHLWPTGSSWGRPLDYGPVLLLMPFGFHLAVDTLPSGVLRGGGFRSTLAVSGFRLRARLGSSIPSHLSPASEALPPLSDIAPLIRAPEGLQPS